jgi:AbrB family looped-hinge helix DNA binding protein
MRITSKGQVTIPLAIRRAAGMLPNSEVEFTIEGEKVIITKAARQPDRGERIVRHLRGSGDVKMSTDQIMALTRGEE